MFARKEDRKDNGDYAKRRFFDLKTTLLIITAMFGTGSITGLTSYLTDPNIKVQAEVNGLKVRANASDLKVADLVGKGQQSTMRMEYYIKSHNDEEELKEKLIDREFEHIKELLLEIRADLKDIKSSP